METLREALEVVAILYVIVSGFSAWVWLFGARGTSDERIQKAKNALTNGSILIWSLVGFCTVMGFFLWIGGLLLRL
jgi:hypothetical protein